MSRSIQLHYVPVTAFSDTDIYFDRISLEWDSRGGAMTNHKKLIGVTWLELLLIKKKSVCKNAGT